MLQVKAKPKQEVKKGCRLAGGEHNKQLCYSYCLPYYGRNHSGGSTGKTSTHNNQQGGEEEQEGDQEVIGGQEIKCNSEVLNIRECWSVVPYTPASPRMHLRWLDAAPAPVKRRASRLVLGHKYAQATRASHGSVPLPTPGSKG